ncbi:MAG: LuxR C-terminal-related transcriptional regulator [Pseudomonadota bacterium]
MAFQARLINEAQRIERETQEVEIWARFSNFIADIGIRFYIYLTVDADRKNPHISTNTGLHNDVASEVFDPFLDYCCQSYDMTRTGAVFLSDYPYLDEASKAFIRQAEAFGFRSGLGIPMRLEGSKRFGGFNLGTGLDRTEFLETVFPYGESLRLLCLIVHRRVEELHHLKRLEDQSFRKRLISPPFDKLAVLSPREREVVFLVSKGFTRQQCADMCGISENTVSTHLRKAYERLGVSNKAQATRLVVESNAI